MNKLVLLRHGESEWNRLNKFTGWTDVPLSPKGIEEAREAGVELLKAGFKFDLAYTSCLKRAKDTLRIVLEIMRLNHIPVTETWRLNERHYGALQGLNKAEMAKKFGERQVLLWRRSYDVRPPALTKEDPRWEGKDPRYKGVPVPLTESLKDTVERVIPCWRDEIAPQIRRGKKVIITASGNSLRALVKHLDNISDKAITELNIPTGIPLVYELDKQLKPIRHYYLGDPKRVQEAEAAVAAQGKAK